MRAENQVRRDKQGEWGSHPDCRCLPILVAALQSGVDEVETETLDRHRYDFRGSVVDVELP
jgi:hypothetical protein